MSATTTVGLSIGGIMAEELVACYGTPLYVYDAAVLCATVERVRTAVPYAPLQLHYACVTNSNAALIRKLLALDVGIHANTWGDAFIALRAGCPAERLVYSGSYMNPDDMANLFQHGVRVNLNSLAQVRTYATALHAYAREHGRSTVADALFEVGLRIHLEDAMPYSRMGVQISDLDEARAIAAAADLSLVGVHFYRGTGTNHTEHFLKPFPQVIEAARHLGDSLQYVDVGGGFGFQYLPGAPTQFAWETFGARMAELLTTLSGDLQRPVTLLLEPGRSLVAASGYLLTRVIGVDRRASGGQVAGVDTTVSHVSSETYRVYGGFRRIVLAGREGDGAAIPTDVVGCTTFSDDYIGRAPRGERKEQGITLPPLRDGDLLAVLDVGGYGYAFASTFLNRPRPAEVMVDNGVARVIRRRESYDDLLTLQVF